jgi:DNA (cytosine-5)-methyltransferase 1
MRDLPPALQHDSYQRRANRRVKDGTPTARRGGAPTGVRRLRADHPSKAITGGAQGEFLHPTEDRPLTPRECARLQTFPDTFRFAGPASDQMRLIGNAVPPLLARAIGEHLMRELRKAAGGSPAEPGGLLSFVPTESAGLSPALRQVVRAVADRFADPGRLQRQLSLWG